MKTDSKGGRANRQFLGRGVVRFADHNNSLSRTYPRFFGLKDRLYFVTLPSSESISRKCKLKISGLFCLYVRTAHCYPTPSLALDGLALALDGLGRRVTCSSALSLQQRGGIRGTDLKSNGCDKYIMTRLDIIDRNLTRT